MVVPEIAKCVLSMKGDAPTERNVFLAERLVWEHLRNYSAKGLIRRVKLKGDRAGRWELVGPAPASSSMPPPEPQVDQRAGV
jgi:hypothetical protein